MVLRQTGVFLLEVPLRQYDGYSIRSYLEGAPETVATLLKELHSSSVGGEFNVTLNEHKIAILVFSETERADGGESTGAEAKLE